MQSKAVVVVAEAVEEDEVVYWQQLQPVAVVETESCSRVHCVALPLALACMANHHCMNLWNLLF